VDGQSSLRGRCSRAATSRNVEAWRQKGKGKGQVKGKDEPAPAPAPAPVPASSAGSEVFSLDEDLPHGSTREIWDSRWQGGLRKGWVVGLFEARVLLEMGIFGRRKNVRL
jgi:hypothetical protein